MRQNWPSEGSDADRRKFDTLTTEVVHPTIGDEIWHKEADDSDKVDNADVLQLLNSEYTENSEPDTASTEQQQPHTSDTATVEPVLPGPPEPPDVLGADVLPSESNADPKPSSVDNTREEPDGSPRCDDPDIGQLNQPTDDETLVLSHQDSDESADSVEPHDADCVDARQPSPNQETAESNTETPIPTSTLTKEPQAGGSDKAESVELTPASTETQETRGPDQPIAESVDAKLDQDDGGRELIRKSIRSPRNIGSRRTGVSGRRTRSPDTSPRPFTPKPELTCRGRAGKWEIALSTPPDCNVETVSHNGTSVRTDNTEYLLQSFSGNLSIEYEDGTEDDIPLVDDKTPLFFKMRRDWQGLGRRLDSLTKGYFVVVTPADWTYKGHVTVEPEGAVDPNCLAHFLYVGDDNQVGHFEEYPLGLTQSGFTLSGECVFDDSPDGSLFVGTSCPELTPTPGIIWARIGEERENGWVGENFKPTDRTLPEVLDGHQGRFFLRVYDDIPQLIDSGAFRYFSDLSEIRVNAEVYSSEMLLTPTPDGYSPMTLRFIAIDGSNIVPDLKTKSPYLTLRQDGTIDISPCPNADKISCSLVSARGSVDLVIQLPRVWWRLDHGSRPSDEWNDRPLIMTRNEFRDYAETDTSIQLCLPREIRSVRVGFGDDVDRTFPVRNGLPLESFVDYDEIDNPTSEDIFLRMECRGISLPLIQITADLPPPQSKTPIEARTLEQPLNPLVKRSDGRLRRGKGFSRGELRATGLTPADSACRRISIDKRRRTVHVQNVLILEEATADAPCPRH